MKISELGKLEEANETQLKRLDALKQEVKEAEEYLKEANSLLKDHGNVVKSLGFDVFYVGYVRRHVSLIGRYLGKELPIRMIYGFKLMTKMLN